MKIAFTGHTNIEKATGGKLISEGSSYSEGVFEKLIAEFDRFIINYCKENSLKFQDIEIISGMARGVDEVAAIMAIRNNWNLILAIPNSIEWHKNRELSRGVKAQAIFYDYILNSNPKEIHEIKKDYGFGHQYANFARNKFMVDIADIVVSYKKYSSTGTDHCINAAIKKGNYYGNIPDLLLSNFSHLRFQI